MSFEQPKPDSKKYADLINEIQKGIIKIPKFQRDFVWCSSQPLSREDQSAYEKSHWSNN